MIKENLCPNWLGLKHPASKAMYEKTINMAEKFSEIIYFVVVNLSVPGVDYVGYNH